VGHYDYENFSGISGFIVLLVIVAFIALAMVIDFFSKVPKWIYWMILVATAMLFEYWYVHMEMAKIVAMACTFIVAALAFIIPSARLENENCKASSVFKLWRRTKLLPAHTGLALTFEALVVVAALFVHFQEGNSVYWPGVITVLIAFPFITYIIGYFTVQSHHCYVLEGL